MEAELYRANKPSVMSSSRSASVTSRIPVLWRPCNRPHKRPAWSWLAPEYQVQLHRATEKMKFIKQRDTYTNSQHILTPTSPLKPRSADKTKHAKTNSTEVINLSSPSSSLAVMSANTMLARCINTFVRLQHCHTKGVEESTRIMTTRYLRKHHYATDLSTLEYQNISWR